MTPEGRIKAKVNRALAQFGNQIYRFMPVQLGYGAPGLDYFLCIRGHFIAIETKAKGKKPTERQGRIMEKIHGAGGTAFVVDADEGVGHLVKYIRALLK